MSKMSKRTKKNIINIAFLIVLVGVTFTVLFTSTDVNIYDVGRFLRSCNPWFITAAFLGMLGYIVFEAISLHIIVRTLGNKCKAVSSLAYSTSDLYYSSITPSASGGQPASAYYMMRDGLSGGTAGFTVLLNIISYTVATILVGLFGVFACPSMFGEIGHWFAQTLIIIGFVIQLLMLALLLLCMFRARIILKIGGFGIAVLSKMRIVKKREKWTARLEGMVNKYRSCRSVMKEHPMMVVNALLLNIAQRVSQTLIPCFVVLAVAPESNFLELFCMQAYVLIGYNSIPLPGGTGVYEYLYPNVFGIGGYNMTTTILPAMMVSRFISYYVCMIVTGIYTLVYHVVGLKKLRLKGDDPPDIPNDVDVYSAMKSDTVLSAIASESEIKETEAAIEKEKKARDKKHKPKRGEEHSVADDSGQACSDGGAPQQTDGGERAAPEQENHNDQDTRSDKPDAQSITIGEENGNDGNN